MWREETVNDPPSEDVLQRFGYRQEFRYVCTRHKLPRSHGFNLGAFEWPVVMLALVWLVFELSIFRDSSFKIPWLYTLLMFGIGLLYFLFMFLTQRDVLKSLPFERESDVPAGTGSTDWFFGGRFHCGFSYLGLFIFFKLIGVSFAPFQPESYEHSLYNACYG